MPKKTILLVDDDRLLSDVLTEFLEDHFTVLCAFNGLEAITIYAQHRAAVELVLTDLRMPKLNGLQLVQWLREQTLSLPIIVMTGYADEREISVFKNIDNVAVIEKPFDFDEIVEVMQRRVRA
jgi:two-component system, cell cycle sensor histidine kinase and response regulator CckA